ncbi:MAG: flagellar biosynthesis protein FlgL [Bradyrhizobiaceae bacterium]|nr:flagellar biosynthesis protein FlgL [Bradyrhizobiaceae bacterium]
MTSITGYTNRSTLTMQMLTQMRWQLDALQRQLATGKRADTYGELGVGRTMDLEARMRLSRLESYENAIYSVDLRVGIMNTALERLRAIGDETRADMRFPAVYKLLGNQTQPQQLAVLRLDEAVSLLNEKAGERYLFSGRATDSRAAVSGTQILDGDGARAGLRQLMAERLLADRGADGRGRLDAPAVAGDVITLAESGAHPFGFKLASVTTDFGATVTPTAGPPASFDLDFGGNNPPDGGRVQVRLTLPDGSTSDLALTATTENPPPAGTFLIGADSDATAANLAAAIDAGILSLGTTELVAASAVRAGEDFFAIDANNPPQRVDGPPFDTATAMRDGTPADTVFWYTGEAATDSARGTAIARVDETITVSYGARANEDGIRQVVQSVAVFASMTFSESDPDGRDRYFALLQRLGSALDGGDAMKQIQAIQTDLAGASLAGNATKERLADKKPVLQGILDEIENISPEEVGVKLLAMNTRMQATMQTTALLSQFTLLSYL